MKWQVDEMSRRWDSKLRKCWADETARCQNIKLMKWQADQMSRTWKSKLRKCWADESTGCQNINLMKWQVDEMSSCQNDDLTKSCSTELLLKMFYKIGLSMSVLNIDTKDWKKRVKTMPPQSTKWQFLKWHYVLKQGLSCWSVAWFRLTLKLDVIDTNG